MIQDRDEQVAALEGYAAREHARLTLLAIQVAAERYPAELRAALVQVFDLEPVSTDADVARDHARGAMEFAYEAQALVVAVETQLQRIEVQVDGLMATIAEPSRVAAATESMVTRAAHRYAKMCVALDDAEKRITDLRELIRDAETIVQRTDSAEPRRAAGTLPTKG